MRKRIKHWIKIFTVLKVWWKIYVFKFVYKWKKSISNDVKWTILFLLLKGNFDFQHEHKPKMKTVICSNIHWIVLISLKEFNFKNFKSAATIIKFISH